MPGSSYSGLAQPSRGEPVDTVRECLEAVPANIALPVLDTGERITLSVLVLLDGTDAQAAEQIFAKLQPRTSR
jgi:hypothetical protein